MKIEDTYFDRDVEKAFMKASAEMYEQKTKASLLISNQNGNMYTPSVYGCLASVLAQYVPWSLLFRKAAQRPSLENCVVHNLLRFYILLTYSF